MCCPQDTFAAYEKLLVFQTMYITACQSPDYRFRLTMYNILERISMPHLTRIQRGWSRLRFWGRGSDTFNIRAEMIGSLKVDLQRIKWTEELKIVRYFSFYPTSPFFTIYQNGRTLNWNRWVYDLVTSVIPADRLIVQGRTGPESRAGGVTFALPELPHTYRILENLAEPPFLIEKAAAEYHGYKPKRTS